MHEGSGTVENMRGSHRSMNNAYAQTDVLFKPITTNPPIQTREVTLRRYLCMYAHL